MTLQALIEALSLFLCLGLVVQIAQMIYNYRSIASAMRSIERAASSGDGSASIAIIPCKIAASSRDEVIYTLKSINRSLDLGYLDKAILVMEHGDEEHLNNMDVDRAGFEILVSDLGICSSCSGKNRALITGLRSLDRFSGDDVVVMLDCDAYHHPRSIFLVSRASSSFNCVVTGYRWYLLRDMYSVLYNVVSSIAFEYMGIERTRIVWGGLASMRLKIIRDLDLENRFKEELSDDAVISSEARRKGYRIVFCSKCISLTPAQRGFKRFYLWAVRQMIILRLYTPRGFNILIAMYALNTLILLLPVITITMDLPSQLLYMLLAPTLGYVVLGALRAAIVLRTYSPESIYPDPDVEKDRRLWRYVYVLVSSLRAPLILSILITARISSRFEWRGVKYCIDSRSRRAIPCS